MILLLIFASPSFAEIVEPICDKVNSSRNGIVDIHASQDGNEACIGNARFVKNGQTYCLKKNPSPAEILDCACECGKDNCFDREKVTLNRIADGQPVRAHDYPWLAFILPSEVDEHDVQRCTGSLISKKFILTSALCTSVLDFENNPSSSANKRDLTVFLGVHDISNIPNDRESIFNGSWNTNGIVVRDVKRILLYNCKNCTNNKIPDAAILIIDEVSFTQNISPICLPSFKHYQSWERIMLKKVFTMVGYGTDKIWIDEYNDVFLDENFKQIDLGEHKQTAIDIQHNKPVTIELLDNYLKDIINILNSTIFGMKNCYNGTKTSCTEQEFFFLFISLSAKASLKLGGIYNVPEELYNDELSFLKHSKELIRKINRLVNSTLISYRSTTSKEEKINHIIHFGQTLNKLFANGHGIVNEPEKAMGKLMKTTDCRTWEHSFCSNNADAIENEYKLLVTPNSGSGFGCYANFGDTGAPVMMEIQTHDKLKRRFVQVGVFSEVREVKDMLPPVCKCCDDASVETIITNVMKLEQEKWFDKIFEEYDELRCNF